MNLQFDIRGNLVPYTKLELTISDFKRIFVDDISGSSTRHLIYQDYIRFINDFSNEITPNFTHWVDGSFISNRLNPNDIDLVTLIDFDVYEKKEQLIESKYRMRGAKEIYALVDAYTIKYYPEHHEKHTITTFDLVYWRNWFSETKKNRMKKQFDKGFIELKFGNKR